MSLATDAVYRNKFKKIDATQKNSINVHSHKLDMYMQKLHHFCNTLTPDGDPRLGRTFLRNK